MPGGTDRREARRYSMSLPMRVLAHESQSTELRASTRNVSYRGLYFLSETKFAVGSQIDFVLTLPQKVSSSGDPAAKGFLLRRSGYPLPRPGCTRRCRRQRSSRRSRQDRTLRVAPGQRHRGLIAAILQLAWPRRARVQ